MTDPGYHALREQIEGLLTETRQLARQASEWQKVEAYWHIGDALAAHVDAHEGSTYGQQVIRNLSKDLQLAQTNLYHILRFRRVVPAPNVYAGTNFSWSHFRALIHLPTPEQFQHYARLAADNGWTTRQLKLAIDAGGDAPSLEDLAPAAGSTLRSRFGRPFVYRVLADRLLDDAPPAIDFGFHQVWVPDEGLAGFDGVGPGDVVQLESTPSGARAQTLARPPRLWTYLARPERIVDGDTLDVVVDLGLGHRAFPRLRLRGIDTAELYTQAGREAKAFVEQALADCPAVVISTWKTDSYGRYLADVKYVTGEGDPAAILEEGTYLNRELLRRGLAVRYLE